MHAILDAIFSSLQPDEMSEAEALFIRRVDRLVQQKLTEEETDLLWQVATDWQEARELDSFRQGFRLGMQLALEGLAPVCPETRPTAAGRAARPSPPR